MALFLSLIYQALVASTTVATIATCTWPMTCPLEERTNVCSIPHTAGADDSPAIEAAFNKCQKNGVITFEEGITYNAFSQVRAWNLSNVEVHINGNITLSTNIADIQAKVAKGVAAEGVSVVALRSADGKAWFRFTGNDVAIFGTNDPKWGWFEGHGQTWWDNVVQENRPKLAVMNVTGGSLFQIKHHALPAWGWSIFGSNISVDHHFVDNRPTNGSRDTTISFPFNTDGVNVAARNVYINDYFGYNGDDAISFIDGASNVTVRNLWTGFSSHGISIGSLGKNGQASRVENILVENAEMENAVYGARFKSWVGGNGIAENVTFRKFRLSNVSTAAFITQNYYDQHAGQAPTNSTTSTQIKNFHFEDFSGYLNPNFSDGTCISDPCWNYVKGGDATQSIILDLHPGTAQNITFKSFNIRPYEKQQNATTVICDPSTFSAADLDKLGFVCQNGPYIAK